MADGTLRGPSFWPPTQTCPGPFSRHYPVLLLVYCCVYFWPSPHCKTRLKSGEGHAFWNQNDLGFLIYNMGR